MADSNASTPPSYPPADLAQMQGRLKSLEHPLPAGMRDRLPEDARIESELGGRLRGCFELYGYERVSAPAFEYADVLVRGLGALEPQEVLRFVEPETGEVVALRPDMTPQVARLLATRLADAPSPARLCYQGSVLRRPRERARKHRQIPQAGIEYVGQGGVDADLEVLELAVESVRRAGLKDFVIDLGHAAIATPLLERVPRGLRDEVVEALSLKDSYQLERLAGRAGLSAAELKALCALPELTGAEEVWERAERVLAGTDALSGCLELKALWTRAQELECALVVDLGETRAFRYYTGFLFQLLAEGPGRAVASGGRYDRLLARFGQDRPAAGMAVDLDNLAWALADAQRSPGVGTRVLVSASPHAIQLVRALRKLGVVSAVAPASDPLGYAHAWRYTHLVEGSPNALELTCLGSGARKQITGGDVTETARGLSAELD
ncbi:MAG: ATP phosphoribosyltransferase regulatory subunit [Polyangiaceae bacterium]|nr:ATP phosphoribosyltransferase regulatory subunit [Polyangiaceae bacterium]